MTTLTIQLPDDVIERLNAKAAARHLKLDSYMSDVLIQDAENPLDRDMGSSLHDVVQQIRALPPRPSEYIQPAVGSLKDALTKMMADPSFDEKSWDERWRQIETELKTSDARDLTEDQGRDLPN